MQGCYADSQTAEAEWIAAQLERLHDSGVPFGEMAVLYRAHYVTRAVEQALICANSPTPYTVVSVLHRTEIKDALCYLRMIAYRDDLSFRRIANVPKRNLGKRRMAFLEERAQAEGRSLYQTLEAYGDDPLFKGTKAGALLSLIADFSSGYEGRPVSEVLSALLNASGYEAMLRTEGSQERLTIWLSSNSPSMSMRQAAERSAPWSIIWRTPLCLQTLTRGAPGDRIKLMTVHAAKGLEFPYVFLCGMNEGIFPSRKTRTLQAMERSGGWRLWL